MPRTNYRTGTMTGQRDYQINEFEAFADERIIGGHDAAPGEFPWVAAIWAEGIFFCGGSLVSPLYVLTAAHCVHRFSNFYVIMGAHELYVRSEATRQSRNTTTVIIHEDFEPKSYKNDIALLRLSIPFFLTPWVRTIRLPSALRRKDNTLDLETATLTGWGLEQYDAPELSTVLQKLDLRLISNEYCALMFSQPDVIGNIQLCANTTKDRSPCRGDSGGALTVVEHDGRRTQIGIDSFSSGACSEGYPEVFSRVSSFVPWLRSKMGFLANVL
ncbi:brachyurin-like [Neodiprion fabricii]|uniref:brachyurin-like n=1 Tax=Neodiprion fabricii TaxID=2872261 RepID=UPI001ED8E31C|nr:brachyurin-like [Neodiprion fabricii]